MLGLIHRTVLGKGPPQFKDFFFGETRPHFPRSLRSEALRHNRQLQDPIGADASNALGRSVLGMIYTYNVLPQGVVDCASVSGFQRSLQKGLAQACEQNLDAWDAYLADGARLMSTSSFQSLLSRRFG